MNNLRNARWQTIFGLGFASAMVALVLYSASQIEATNPPIVNFGTSTILSQTNWDGGAGTNTSSQYASATNIDETTSGQIVATSTVTSTQNNWYNSSWSRRRAITIDANQVSSTESNFPVLITEANFDATFFNNLRSDGLDLIFTASDGTTLLDREIASVSTTAQTLEAWVRIPSLSGTTDTEIYAYYGNSGTSVANATTTWDSSIFTFVAHLNEDPAVASNPLDSLNGASGSYANSPTATSGPFGYAVQFNGTNQYISFADASYLDLGNNYSLSAWANPSNTSVNARILNKSNVPNHWQNSYEIGALDTGAYESYSYTDAGSFPGTSFANQAVVGTWNKIAVSFDRGNDAMTMMVDGVATSTSDISGSTGSPVNTTEPLFIGAGSATNEPYPGAVDEIRLYGITVSTSWFAIEYNNQSDPASFYSVASEEVYWYDSDWAYRREIQVDPSQVSSTQTNFPMLITGSGFDTDFWNNINSNGSDILFTQDDGATLLAREVVAVSTTAQTLEAYVTIPSLSDTTTTSIYVYYGNSSASLTNSSSVWNNQLAVWHFAEDPSVTTDGDCGGGTDNVCDSSANGNHATSSGFSASNATSSPIGTGYEFDTGRRLNAQSDASIDNLNSFSISLWLHPYSAFNTDNTHTIFEKICSFNGWQFYYDNDGDVWNGSSEPAASRVLSWDKDAATDPYKISADGGITEDAWQYITFTWDNLFGATSGRYYRNGVEMGYFFTQNGATPTVDDSCGDLFIGARGGESRYFHGGLDEMRITSSTLSTSYVLTEYNNQNSPGTFYSVGSHSTVLTSGAFATGTLVSAIYDVGSSITAWGTVRWTTDDESNTIVKVRTSNDSGMSGATDFDSCTAFSQDDDISANSCVTDGERYLQYQIQLTTSTVTFQDIAIQALPTATATISEAAGTAIITFSIDEASGVDVTVPFTVSGSSTPGSDHDLVSGSIIIPAGQLSAVTTTNITNDTAIEGDETLILTMGSPTNGVAGNQSVYNLTIQDDDLAGVTITTSSLAIAEGGATATYTIALAVQPTSTVTIALSTSTDSDSTLSTSSITFTSTTWDTPVTVTVTAVDDDIAEGTHTATITHTVSQSGGNYDGLSVSNVQMTVTDNDTAGVTVTTSTVAITETGTTATYTIQLDSEPTSTVTIAVNPDSESTVSTSSIDFTASNWNSPVTVTVTAVDDSVVDGVHNTTISHSATQGSGGQYDGFSISSVVMAVTDDDTAGVTITTSTVAITEAGTTATYTIELAAAPTSTVTITVSPDGESSVSTSSVSFTSTTWNSPVTVTVTAVDDGDIEGTHSTVISHSIAQSPAGAFSSLSVDTVTMTITDDDTVGVTVTTSTVAVTEGGATATYTIALAAIPTSTVTITLSTSTNGVTVSPSTLTFTTSTWSTAQTITVTATDDSAVEGTHTSDVVHTVSNSGGSYDGFSVPNVTFTITDDDSASVTVSVGSLSLTEGGSTGSYTIVLGTQPSTTVDITLATSTSEASISTTSIRFTTSNWDSAQTITVTPVDDDLQDGTATSVISHVASSSDGNYDGISISSVTTTIADNDTAGVTVSESAISLTEGGSADTYTIVLNAQPSSTVQIAITTSTSAFTVSTSSLTFTTSNWDTAQTVTTSPPSDDSIAEYTVSSTITHAATSVDSNYNGISINSVVVTLSDDDTAGITLSDTALTFTEGSTDSYTVALSSEPTSTVTLTITTSSAEATISTTSITFTASNYSTAVTVSVSSTDNSDVDGTRSVTLTHSVSSADSQYNGVSTSTVTVSIGDNDTAATNDSGGGPAAFTFLSVPTNVNTTPSGETSTQEETSIACPLTPGTAYKGDSSSAVYLVTSICTLRPFQNPEAYFSYFDSWNEVTVLPQSEIDNTPNDPVDFVPKGPKYDPKYGALVKTVNDPKVYLLLGTERYWINSESVFTNLNYQWNWIEDVSPELLNQYTEGEEITYIDHHPNYTIVKYPDDPKVYRLEPDPTDATKQVKRHIPDETTFESLNFRWDRIVILDPSETYPDGEILQ